MSKYQIDGDGKLFREGVHIADVNKENELTFTDGKHAKYKQEVEDWISSNAGVVNELNLGGSDAPLGTGGASASVQPAPAGVPGVAPGTPVIILNTPEERRKAENESMTEASAREAEEYRKQHLDDVEFARKNKLPAPPKKNPQFGDKTKAYVEWLREYRPDKFAEKYGVTGTGRVPVIQTNPHTQLEEVVGERAATFATRKNHLTDKVEGGSAIGEDQDWKA